MAKRKEVGRLKEKEKGKLSDFFKKEILFLENFFFKMKREKRKEKRERKENREKRKEKREKRKEKKRDQR